MLSITNKLIKNSITSNNSSKLVSLLNSLHISNGSSSSSSSTIIKYNSFNSSGSSSGSSISGNIGGSGSVRHYAKRTYHDDNGAGEDFDHDFDDDIDFELEEKKFKKEKKVAEEWFDDEDRFGINDKHSEKVEKSKRTEYLKKPKRVSPVEVFRDEIDRNKDGQQVDYVEGKIHSFPPLPGKRRTKLRSYDQEDDNQDDDDDDFGEYSTKVYKAFGKKDRFYGDQDDDADVEAIENYGREDSDDEEMIFYKTKSKSDYDAEDYEFGFLTPEEKQQMRAKLEYQRKKEGERDERRKRKLIKSGFNNINEIEKRRQDLALQLRQKGDRRLKNIKYPLLSENEDLALITFQFFRLLGDMGEKVLYNDDVLDVERVSVINVDGSKLGEMSGPEAYKLAYNTKNDIFIQYTPTGQVTGRLMKMADYIVLTEKKMSDDLKKKKDSETKSTKNVLFSSLISDHDRDTKIEQVKNFLLKRHTVEVTLTFKEEIDTQYSDEFFSNLEKQLVGIAKVQAKYNRKGSKIASNFYHPLNIKDRENYIRRVEREETEAERRLREQLEREELDAIEERGQEADMSSIAVKVDGLIRKKKMEQMFDESDLHLLLEDERKQQKKKKNQEMAGKKKQLAPTQGEGLSNKQIKQNINKNKNKLKKLQKGQDDDELF